MFRPKSGSQKVPRAPLSDPRMPHPGPKKETTPMLNIKYSVGMPMHPVGIPMDPQGPGTVMVGFSTRSCRGSTKNQLLRPILRPIHGTFYVVCFAVFCFNVDLCQGLTTQGIPMDSRSIPMDAMGIHMDCVVGTNTEGPIGG